MSKLKDCGIYCIYHKTLPITYIGSSIDIKRRWNAGYKGCSIQKYFDLYGKKNFVYEVLEFCDEDIDENDLIILEQKYLNEITNINKNKAFLTEEERRQIIEERKQRYRQSEKGKKKEKEYTKSESFKDF
jgi:hypothetical protein